MLLRVGTRALRGVCRPRLCALSRQQRPAFLLPAATRAAAAPPAIHKRLLSTAKSSADDLIEDITEQYATAKDEFEIAVEETEKNTVYAAEDRAAAAEEMATLQRMYDRALAESPADVAADIKRRIGQRIRELDEAIKGLEESAKQGD